MVPSRLLHADCSPTAHYFQNGELGIAKVEERQGAWAGQEVAGPAGRGAWGVLEPWIVPLNL